MEALETQVETGLELWAVVVGEEVAAAAQWLLPPAAPVRP
jgi:hypothetical protein